jgi:transposase
VEGGTVAAIPEEAAATDEVAVEVTGKTRWFYEAVAPSVARVVVVDPNQFRVISHSVKKTDPNDARNLALYLAKGLLPEVRMKEKGQAEVASLTQTRDRLVKLRTALKNKVNNLLSARGIELDKESLSSEKGLAWVLEQKLEPLARLELDVIVEQIRSLNRSIARLERVIDEAGKKLKGYQNLTSIKGIGSLGAGILLSVIGNVSDFAHEGKLAAYFGIVPRVHDSNETEHRGRITKRGSKLGRTALVQCALIAKRYSPISTATTNAFELDAAPTKRSSLWRASSSASSITPSRTTGIRRLPQFRAGGCQDLTTTSAEQE